MREDELVGNEGGDGVQEEASRGWAGGGLRALWQVAWTDLLAVLRRADAEGQSGFRLKSFIGGQLQGTKTGICDRSQAKQVNSASKVKLQVTL